MVDGETHKVARRGEIFCVLFHQPKHLIIINSLLTTENHDPVISRNTQILAGVYARDELRGGEMKIEIDLPDIYESFLRLKAEIHRVDLTQLIISAVIQAYPMDFKEKKTVRQRKAPIVTDEAFIQALKLNAAYEHLNVDIELGRMDAWLLAHPGREKTRKFIVDWLNRQQKPLTRGPPGDLKLNSNLEAIAEAQRRRDERRNIQQRDGDLGNLFPQPAIKSGKSDPDA